MGFNQQYPAMLDGAEAGFEGLFQRQMNFTKLKTIDSHKNPLDHLPRLIDQPVDLFFVGGGLHMIRMFHIQLNYSNAMKSSFRQYDCQEELSALIIYFALEKHMIHLLRILPSEAWFAGTLFMRPRF